MSEIQIRSTGTTEVIQSSDGRITLSVPIQIKRRSGRKQMTLPNGCIFHQHLDSDSSNTWTVIPATLGQ